MSSLCTSNLRKIQLTYLLGYKGFKSNKACSCRRRSIFFLLVFSSKARRSASKTRRAPSKVSHYTSAASAASAASASGRNWKRAQQATFSFISLISSCARLKQISRSCHIPIEPRSFLLLVAMPGAPLVASLLLVAMPLLLVAMHLLLVDART